MSRRMWAIAVAAWVAVVIVGSAVTWIAIERAGDQVSATPESAETTQPPVLGTVGPAPSTAPGTPTTSVAPTPHPSTVGTAGPTASSRPSTTPRPATAFPKPSSQPAPRTVVRTWSGAPGSLTVACTGGQVSFRSATPSNGWSFERNGSSGEDIEVTFKSGESEVQVLAICSGGVPQFRVQSEGDHERAGSDQPAG